MRLIDADALIEGRVDNDPVVIARMNAPRITTPFLRQWDFRRGKEEQKQWQD